MAMVSPTPDLKVLTLRVTFLPRAWAKKPLSTPTRAGACVMLARKPRRRVTAAALEPEFEPEPGDAADELHPAASTVTATAPAASSARRIKVHLIDQVNRFFQIKPYRRPARRSGDRPGDQETSDQETGQAIRRRAIRRRAIRRRAIRRPAIRRPAIRR